MKSWVDSENTGVGIQFSYGPHFAQQFELILPENSRCPPVVLMIHGGFWKREYDAQHLRPLAQALANCGFATVLAEYRRIGHDGFGWPGTFEDLVKISVAMDQLCQAYDLDPERILALGHSAGGQLALWLGACQTHPDLQSFKCPIVLRGVLGLAPVCDLEKTYELALSKGVVSQFLGGSPSDKSEIYRFASPSQLLPLKIPHIIIHGMADEDVPFSMSESYIEKAQQAGQVCRLIALPANGHMDLIDPEKECFAILKKSLSDLLVSLAP